MRAGIALGSNVGDRLRNLQASRDRILAFHEGEKPPLFSDVYETAPVDCAAGTDPFLNAVIEIESKLSPLELLDRAQQIELDLGRSAKRAKNSPRTIDVDLLYLGHQEFRTRRLELPHPRLLERRFVLVPLCEIRPELVVPGATGSVKEILNQLDSSEQTPNRLISKW